MNSLELVNKLYKPYRITKLSKCTIIDSLDGKFVVKPKGEKNIRELFSYLKSRNFQEFPTIVDDSRSDIDIFEFIDDAICPKEQKAEDLVKLLAKLHDDTAFTKEVREDKFKEIYDNIKENILFYKSKYEEMMNSFESEIFMSPSHYLFAKNSSKLFNQMSFCENKLDEWYSSVKDKRETRVSLIHNNLSLEHYIKGEKEALISWDKATTDSPILDFYKFYHREALNLEFGTLLKTYNKYFPLEKDELSLLLIMLCLPRDIEFDPDEFKSCENISRCLDYVYKTENLVRPYFQNSGE